MANVSGWTEGILLTMTFVAVFGLVVSGMNLQYDKDYSVGLTDDSDAEALFIQYQDTAEQQIQGGEVEFDATQGITLKSSYGITKDAINIIWTFLSGGFIERVVESWGVGEAGSALAKTIRVIYFLSLVFALLFALFKTKI